MIKLVNVCKRFGSDSVFDGVDLEVREGEKVVILGPSGSGKSTLLRCINGLEPIDSGEIYANGRPVHDPKTDLRLLRQEIGMVFQTFELYPHLTAKNNISLAPIKVRKIPKAQDRHRQSG